MTNDRDDLQKLLRPAQAEMAREYDLTGLVPTWQAAKIADVTKATLYAAVRRQELAPYAVGSLLFWSEEQVREWATPENKQARFQRRFDAMKAKRSLP